MSSSFRSDVPPGRSRRKVAAEVRGAVYEGDRQLRRTAARFGEDVREIRLSHGLSQAAVARAVGVSRSVICLIEAGRPAPGTRIRARVAALLGAEFRMAIFADADPLITDAAQARIVELLVRSRHPTWRATVEAPIPGPGRRSSDLRLERDHDVVLIEVETRVRRWEEIVRELHDKRTAVEPTLPPARACHCVLVLPSTRHHRAIARAQPATLETAFPAPATALRDALVNDCEAWPGDGIMWVSAGRSPCLPQRTPMARPRPPGRSVGGRPST